MSATYSASCGCGWTSPALSSQAKADYSLRRHSCERHAMRLARAERVAARKAASGPVRDCGHVGADGSPRHAHGERNAYVLDRCRCRPCRDAASDYERRRAKDRAYGRQAYVDAEPVRAHIEALRAQGMGWKRVALAAGIETSVVWKILYGDPSRGQAPSKRVMPKTAEAILAVTLNLAPGRTVDGTGTRRRLQALAAVGWSQQELGRRLGILPGNIHKLFHDEGRGVTVATRDAVRALYDELWDAEPPPRTRVKVQNVARRYGWVPPLAWDDESIDDPAAVPFVDDASLVGGRRPTVTVEDLWDCAGWGLTIDRAAERLGVSRDAVDKALSRSAGVELREAFARNARARKFRDAS